MPTLGYTLYTYDIYTFFLKESLRSIAILLEPSWMEGIFVPLQASQWALALESFVEMQRCQARDAKSYGYEASVKNGSSLFGGGG